MHMVVRHTFQSVSEVSVEKASFAINVGLAFSVPIQYIGLYN